MPLNAAALCNGMSTPVVALRTVISTTALPAANDSGRDANGFVAHVVCTVSTPLAGSVSHGDSTIAVDEPLPGTVDVSV